MRRLFKSKKEKADEGADRTDKAREVFNLFDKVFDKWYN